MLPEILEFLPAIENGSLLDVTAGGGGHFFEILRAKPNWKGQCWDRDPDALGRINAAGHGMESRFKFSQQTFGEGPAQGQKPFDYILADLGISSFQIDDPTRGLSFHSKAPLDFRMNPQLGPNFTEWVKTKKLSELEDILVMYGEELRAKKIAQKIADMSPEFFVSAKAFADELMKQLNMRIKKNESHPLTRVFQAFRIAVNGELSELEALLQWAPPALSVGGRLSIISFHSLEDRKVKRAFLSWQEKGYRILTDKALTPSEQEVHENTRSRSAKLRVLERVSD